METTIVEDTGLKIIKAERYPIQDTDAYSEIVVEFSIPEETRKELHWYESEYVSVRVMDSEEDYDNYVMGLVMNVDEDSPDKNGLYPVDIHSTYEKSPETKITSNYYSRILEFDDEQGVYQFCELVENNPVTDAAFAMVKEIQSSGNSKNSTRLNYSQLICALRTLDLFWY